MNRRHKSAAFAAIFFFVSANAYAGERARGYETAVSPDPWTGFYIGGNLGLGLASNKWTDVSVPQEVGRNHKAGFLGGAQLGADYRISSLWVIGIQGMFDWTDLETNGPNEVTCIRCGLRDIVKTTSLTTVTGRLGYLIEPTALLYAKAGAAWARNNYRLPEAVALGSVGETNETRSGFDVGAGLEWIVAPSWSMSVEYNYVGFDSFSWHPGSASFDVRSDIQTVLVGLNYRFGR